MTNTETMPCSETLLDTAHERLTRGEIFEGMEELRMELAALRTSMPRVEWQAFCGGTLRSHPVLHFVHQAPLARRAFGKPRGYAGDAVMLDFIYGIHPLPADLPESVRSLSSWEFQTQSGRSVRARKSLLAEHIDSTKERGPRPRILSLACGHLREAREAELVLDRQAGAFVAVDQDPESLAVVASELGSYGVEAVHGSVRGVLANRIVYSEMDLVYAAGLYDYLEDTMAIQLTTKLFNMLRSGGSPPNPKLQPFSE